jgi:RNA polymerase sigma-70 factor (ECF subfamily)
VQEVFLQALRLRAVQPIRHWAGFLRRLAACRALDRLRQRKRTVALDDQMLASSTNGPPEAAMGRELAERLRRAVARLPEREAAVFCLRYFDDLSNQRIAETLDITPGAVAVALHKARAKLEEMLIEKDQGDLPCTIPLKKAIISQA